MTKTSFALKVAKVLKCGSTWEASPRCYRNHPPPPKRPSVRPKPETQEALRKKIRSALPSKPVNMKHRNIGTERRVIVLKHIGIQSWNYVHQQHACHFKMPFWLVDKPQSLVDKVNMCENAASYQLCFLCTDAKRNNNWIQFIFKLR